MVPEGWKLRTINDVGSVITGSTPKTSDQTLYDGPVPFVSPADLGTGRPVTSTIKTLTEKGFAATRRIRKGSTLFTCIGSTIGKIGLAGVDLATNQQINSVVPNSSHDDAFIYYALALRARHIAMLAGKQAVPIINKSMFSDQPILTPPLPEQKKIAQILSTWDQAITATERLLENSQQRKKGLMQQLLTGKKRLPGFEGEWEEGHLKDITAISKGKALSSKDLEDGVFPVVAGGKTSPYTHKTYTHDHAITVSASGAYAGYVAYHEYKFWASDCSVVEATDRSVIEFLYHLMTWNQKRIYALQSGGAQPHVYPKDLHALRVLIPPKSEQKAIADVLTVAGREIGMLKSKIDFLRNEKKALMQQLLTGKRRVKVEADVA